jgi:hypothetical protein
MSMTVKKLFQLGTAKYVVSRIIRLRFFFVFFLLRVSVCVCVFVVQLYTVVSVVNVADFKGLQTENVVSA